MYRQIKKAAKEGKTFYSYELVCNKICGASHYNMQMKIIVEEEEDFNKKHQFHSLDELKQHRNSQNIVPLSELQAQKYLQSKTNLSDEKSVRVAYDLQKQLEQTKERNQDFWKSLQLLNN
mgnify:CR=1 FL=1